MGEGSLLDSTDLDGSPQLSDDELTALALAADPDEPLAEDAVPIGEYLEQNPTSSLPQWYMPAIAIRGSSRWRTPVLLAIIAAFLIIEACGLCSTYGQLPIG